MTGSRRSRLMSSLGMMCWRFILRVRGLMRLGILPLRDVSEAFLSAVAGSNSPVVTCDVWLGGEVVREDVRIAGGQVEFDADRNVEGSLSITLVDETEGGSRLSDNIHAIGMRVNVRAGFDLAGDVETVSMGWFDIYDTESVDAWEWYDWRTDSETGEPIGIKTSSVVHVQGLDLL